MKRQKKPTSNVIEINGKRYDARSGRLLDAPAAVHKAEPAPKTVAAPVATKTAVATAAAPAAPAPAAKPKPIADIKRAPAPAGKRPHAERSQTLMRHVVKKPSVASLKRSVRVHTPTDLLAPAPVAALAPKLSFDSVDEKRLRRAHRVAKSRLVSRFSLNSETPKVSHPVLPAQPATAAIAPPAAPPSKAASQPLDIFEKALERAESHLQKPPKRTARPRRRARRTAVRATAAAAVVVAIGGLVALQNLTSWQLRYAGSKTGFAVAAPAYRPEGFSLAGYNYSPGKAVLRYVGDGQRAYTISESVSNWDSLTLLDAYVLKTVAGDRYQTIEAGGRTIYIYGQNDASWVNNNVWYQLHSAENLSTSQVIRIASSL